MNENNQPIEDLLRRYRPMGPPSALRVRVLRPHKMPQHRLWSRFLGWSAAAMLVLSLGLQMAARSMTRETAEMLYGQCLQWAPAAQEVADLLDGDGRGRQYVAFALWAEARRPKGFPTTYPILNSGDNLR